MAEIPMLDKLYMGRGVNSITGKVYGTALEFDTPQSDTTGQKVTLPKELYSPGIQKMVVSLKAGRFVMEQTEHQTLKMKL